MSCLAVSAGWPSGWLAGWLAGWMGACRLAAWQAGRPSSLRHLSACFACAPRVSSRQPLTNKPEDDLLCTAGPNTPDDKPPSSSQEIKPYGISMVQADHPAVQAAARSAADNVLFCVISDGVAATHPDLAGNNLRGNGTCYNETVLVTSEGDIVSAVQVCTRWDDPQTSLLGTHVVGTIAALQNGQGVVGTSSTKSNVYMINGFGSRDFLYDDEILDGVGDCISELERLQKSNPATKMVVNINGAGERYAANPNPNGTAYNRPANQLTTHYTGVFAYFEKPFNKMYKRGDVLFIAPSG